MGKGGRKGEGYEEAGRWVSRKEKIAEEGKKKK
jgi:hypothetical protein